MDAPIRLVFVLACLVTASCAATVDDAAFARRPYREPTFASEVPPRTVAAPLLVDHARDQASHAGRVPQIVTQVK